MSLTDLEVASMRTESELYLPDLCSISRDTAGEDAYGGETHTPAVVASGVPCAVDTPQVEETQIASKQTVKSTWIVHLSALQDVKVGDTITLTSLGGHAGRVTEVAAPLTWEVERVVYVQEMI